MKTIFVFVPDSLTETSIGFLEGCLIEHGRNCCFYIIDDELKVQQDCVNLIGFCSYKTPENVAIKLQHSGWVHINNTTREIKVYSELCKEEHRTTCVYYDYKAFSSSSIATGSIENYGEYFLKLMELIQSHQQTPKKQINSVKVLFMIFLSFVFHVINHMEQVLHKVNSKFKYSATLLHLENRLATIKWCIANYKTNNKMNLTVRNTMTSVTMDVILGLVFLYYCSNYVEEIVEFTNDSAEYIIQNLKQLLLILMGSPAGLKLNYAFNNTLGKFFFYHMALWRAFIFSSDPVLRFICYFFILPGGLGLSFQVALLTDFLAFATFHVYCIYVYAARLYWLQIQGLRSLWQLFLGRKFNPLRNRVDSCDFTQHQLFIGTLAFTVLLFLLPTTLLYYTVFACFRIVLVIFTIVLTKLKNTIQYFPLCIGWLWFINSPDIKGTIYMQMDKTTKVKGIYVTLNKMPLWNTIQLCTPKKFVEDKEISLKTLFQNGVTGVLI